MVERLLSMQEAQGSIPCSSTAFFVFVFVFVLFCFFFFLCVLSLPVVPTLDLPTQHLTVPKPNKKLACLDRGSNTGPLDLQSNALPTELSKQHTSLEEVGSGV